MPKFFSYRRVGLIFSVVFLTLEATQTGHAQSRIFNNWSGFETNTAQIAITAQWTVPTVTFVNYGSSASQERASVWIGIGGVTGNLLQAGTDSTVTSTGSATYTAWLQTVPDAGLDSDPLTGCRMLSGPTSVPCTVSAGDTMQVEIVCNNGAMSNCPIWTANIIDFTQGWTWSNGNINFVAAQTSAEFIVEAPRIVGSISPLPNFGTVAFQYAQVSDISSFSVASNGDTMVDPNGGCANPTGAVYDSSTRSATLTVNYASCPAKPVLAANTHDFNFDGHSDIAWRDTSGDLAIWLMNGGTLLQSGGLGAVPTTWSVIGQRDFNGDGDADLLWRDNAGDLSMWLMNGLTVSSAVGLGDVPTTWTVDGTGDLNGDGKGDLLWRDAGGDVAIWFMNGGTVASTASLGNVPTTWTIVGDDNKGDIFWHDNSGNYVVWQFNGSQVTQSTSLGNVPLATWQIAGIGDFNGDGNTDILWRDTSGDVAIWFLSSSFAVQSAASVGNVPPTWTIAQTGDYNGDGYSDILWIDASGDVAAWFMYGAAIVSTAGLGNVGTAWTAQAQNVE